MAMEKDPSLFGLKEGDASANYGAMGKDGSPVTSTALTDEEREELKAQVMASSSKLCSKCCSQGFLLLIVLLFVGKIQGAGYSAILIISPMLLVVRSCVVCNNCNYLFIINISSFYARLVSYCAVLGVLFLELQRCLRMESNLTPKASPTTPSCRIRLRLP